MNASLPNDPFAEHMPAVAQALYGKPNPHQSKPGKPRWGSKGSLAIDEVRGVWYDHENGTGGGLLDLIKREKSLTGADAFDWLKSIGCEVDRKPKMNGATPHTTQRAARRKIIESYDYIDLDGTVIVQALRFGFLNSNDELEINAAGKLEKTFGQRRPYPSNPKIWIWGASAGEYMRKGSGQDWYRFNEQGWEKLPTTRERQTFEAAKVIPYRLPELTEAIACNHPVFIVEGEQKVEALAKRNLIGTCNIGGAGKWTAAHAAYLQGADVIILPDNDDSGRNHAEQVAKSPIGIASRILYPRAARTGNQRRHCRLAEAAHARRTRRASGAGAGMATTGAANRNAEPNSFQIWRDVYR